MKFLLSSSALYNHLQAIGRVINAKNSLPILDSFLFELEGGILSLTASDNETTMTTQLPVTESDGDMRFAITSRTILEALKEIPEQPLTFDLNPSTMEVQVDYMNGHYSLVAQNADEYPIPVEPGEDAAQVEMSASVFYRGINRMLFATGDDELRPVMNGIFFDITAEDLTMVASDGYTLVRNRYLSMGSDKRASFILPKKPANILKNVLGKEDGIINITFDNRSANFEFPNYRLVCRLIEGRYPNYNSVIPQNNPNKAILDRSAFLSALRRVAVFSSQATSLIKLHLEKNEMVISAQNLDFSTSAQEKLACEYSGNPLSIGFKASFLTQMLSNLPGQEVIIELNDPSRAGVLVPAEQEEHEDLLMLLMPMMLND